MKAGTAKELRGEWSASSRLIRALILVQLLAIVVVGGLTAIKYTTWSLDEGAHYDYIQYIAEDGRLPVLGEDFVHDDTLALGTGSYPRPSGLDPRDLDLAGKSYEAFQPPLYYAAVAPVWHLTSDHALKYRLLRMVGIGFLLLTAAVLLVLCRRLVGREWPRALAFALIVLTAPGFFLRGVMIGNAALEPLVATAFITLAVIAWQRTSYRWLAAAGALLGCCILTRLLLAYLIPVFVALALAIWWKRDHAKRQLASVAVAGLIPLLMLAPWLAFNRSHFDAWTASELARDLQRPIINPDHRDFDVFDGIADIPSTLDFMVPQESGATFSIPGMAILAATVRVTLLPLAIIFMIAFLRRRYRSGSFLVCTMPLAFAVGGLILSTAQADWPQMLPRYVYGAVPAFVVVAYCVYRSALAGDRDYDRFVTVLAALSMFALGWLTYRGYSNHGLWV